MLLADVGLLTESLDKLDKLDRLDRLDRLDKLDIRCWIVSILSNISS